MMKLKFLILACLVLLLACSSTQNRPTTHPNVSSGIPIGVKPPDEPILNLAYRAALQIQSGLSQAGMPMQLKMLPLDNGAGIPPDAANYFQAVLMTRLQAFGVEMPGDAGIQLQGSIYWLRDQLVYGLKLRKGDQAFFSDSVSIPRDQRLENTLAQFSAPMDTHHHHQEVSIPTPVAQLNEAPLDVAQMCSAAADACDIVLLYPERIEILNWKTLAKKIRKIPTGFFSATRSRAPSGKVLQNDAGFVVLNNNLSGPLNYDSEFNGPISPVPNAALPIASPGYNSYSLGDGRFSDFELLPDGMAVVETNHHLSIAKEGALLTAVNLAGGALATRWPAIYTSAPVPSNQTDSVQKYTYQNGIVTFDSSRPAIGAVRDLSVTDLNRDGTPELLVTVQRSEGVFIEVWETF